ncbi:hypothetical protein SMKC032_45280 [Serratia marcescens]|nr:hypothetical protein SMKC032_45280 [Serratia marcescens]CAF2517131.1 hypothetical protein AI2857V1_0264 [Serratia marcescens]CAH5055127.1 hypothetical protein AI2857V1_0264 [Serratia marcescens]
MRKTQKSAAMLRCFSDKNSQRKGPEGPLIRVCLLFSLIIRLMRATLRDAQPGLRTDKLSPEAFPLLLPGQ